MTLKKLSLAAIAGTALLAASSAFADSGHRGHGHGYGHGWQARHQHQQRFHHYGHRPVVVRPAPVYHYVPPRPVVVYPQPVYVEPRPVVVYRQPGFSVSFGF